MTAKEEQGIRSQIHELIGEMDMLRLPDDVDDPNPGGYRARRFAECIEEIEALRTKLFAHLD